MLEREEKSRLFNCALGRYRSRVASFSSPVSFFLWLQMTPWLATSHDATAKRVSVSTFFIHEWTFLRGFGLVGVPSWYYQPSSWYLFVFFSIMGFEKDSNLVHGWINVGNKKGNRLSDNKQTIGVDLNHSSSMEQAAFAFIAIHKQRHNYVYLFMYLSTIQTKSTQSSFRSSQALHVIVSLWWRIHWTSVEFSRIQ